MDEIRGRHNVTHSEPGHRECFGESVDGDRALPEPGECGNAVVMAAVVQEFLIQLIGDHNEVVAPRNGSNLLKRSPRLDRSCGIVWCDDDDRFCPGRDAGLDLCTVNREVVRPAGRHRDKASVCNQGIASVLVIVRRVNQDLISWIEQGLAHDLQGFLCAGGHEDLSLWIRRYAVFSQEFVSNGRA